MAASYSSSLSSLKSYSETSLDQYGVDFHDMDHANAVVPTLMDNGRGDTKSRPARPNQARLSLNDVEPVNIQIRDLSVSIDTAPSLWDPPTYPDLLRNALNSSSATGPDTKPLLHSVSASIAPGSLTAILGGSGSGKTTMLNTVAERMFSSRLLVSGQVSFNGAVGVDSVRHAYVMQQDILLPTLTVRETLLYAANLRSPPSVTAKERLRTVDEVIRELGLKDCADTRIGNGQHRGCSGGEKRRVSIGVQLLANPSVLFLDEPTTGLDATSAFQVVRTLKGLAAKGRTIITTIHQPRSEIWDLFDNLIILSKGSPVYSGPSKNCIPWFSSIGFQLPPFVNPAEYLIDQAAVDSRTPEIERKTTQRVQLLKAAWAHETNKPFLTNIDVGSFTRRGSKCRPSKGSSGQYRPPSQKHHVSFFSQVAVLTNRTFKTTYRDPMGFAGAILEAVLMAIITGYAFYNLPRDLAGIRSREAALYISCGLQGYLFLLFEVYRLTEDIKTFDRENIEGCVTAMPFIVSRRLAHLFTEDIPVPFLYSAIYYFMAGFDRDLEQFFTFFSVLLLNHYIAVTLAMTCIATFRHFPGASLIANLAFTLQSGACGYYIQANSLPIYVRWMKWITYTFYAFGALCGNEFHKAFYDCPAPGASPENGLCAPYTGDYIMDSLGFPRPENWISTPIAALVGFVAFFFSISWFGLAFIKVEMTIAGRGKGAGGAAEKDRSAGKEKIMERNVDEVRSIDVGLHGFSLKLDKWALSGKGRKKLPTKTILEPVTAMFPAGTLSVVMGPSGSGKTSLLNALALRLRGSMGTRYRRGGDLRFNGAVPSEEVVRSVVSYVCQDDDALLPCLTVRETLRFAAGLRLPSSMSREEKSRRAEDVLLKMGLRDCADNLVGSELAKGISGGEKRRVSIGIQILTDPRVLLLDEPTSGLDAFTAASILEVLHGLAREGRTLILTIHQARSDLFRHFGNVLLLARGGKPVYAGAAPEMLPWFAAQGHQCPQHTNPADYALDIITIETHEEQKETASRGRVEALVEAWAKVGRAAAYIDREESRLSSNEDTEGNWRLAESIALEKQYAISAPRHSFREANVATPAQLGALVRKPASFLTAFPLILHRSSVNFFRQPPLIVARFGQVLALSLGLALFFAPLGNSYVDVQNRVGFIQEICAFYFVGMLQNVAVFPGEREVFYRENDDGVYGVEVFLAVYTLMELPFEIINSLIFAVLANFAVGLPRTIEMFLVCFFASFGVVNCGESLGIMFNTLFEHTGFAVNIISILLSVAQIIAGVMSIHMPEIMKSFNYISPLKYAVLCYAHYSLEDVDFTCTASERLPTGSCPVNTGQDVLDLYKLNGDGVKNIVALAGTTVVYRLVAWAVLKVKRTNWKMVADKKMKQPK